MKPILPHDERKEPAKGIPTLPLNSSPSTYSATNRKAGAYTVQRIYPWLLFTSTAVAAVFCLAYITKPVILTASAPLPELPLLPTTPPSAAFPPESETSLLPGDAALPGDPSRPSPGSTAGSPAPSSSETTFEDTNLRIQHVLDATSATGESNRIFVDVPVIYESRTLRWSSEEATEARELLARLNEHQERIRELSEEGSSLLAAWNHLMDGSIPAEVLRADSPSLPMNQYDPMAPAGSSASDTIDSIKLNTPVK